MVTSRVGLDRADPPLYLGEDERDPVHLEVADLDRGAHHARHDIRRPRHGLDPADRGDLASRHGVRDLVDGEDEVGGGDERVAALGHGGRPGVVLHARHGHGPATDADNALDDADLDAVGFQERALLDVHLEEARDAAPARRCASAMRAGSPPMRAVPSLMENPDAVTDVELEGGDPADQRTAPRLAAFPRSGR